MDDRLSSNVSDSVNNKEHDSNKERPKNLDLESCNVGNDEEQGPDDTRPAKRWFEIDQFFWRLWVGKRLVQ